MAPTIVGAIFVHLWGSDWEPEPLPLFTPDSIHLMNISTGYAPPRRPRHAARRRGQVLLVAVLLMILAAFLGSTFVAVVMINASPAAHV